MTLLEGFVLIVSGAAILALIHQMCKERRPSIEEPGGRPQEAGRPANGC